MGRPGISYLPATVDRFHTFNLKPRLCQHEPPLPLLPASQLSLQQVSQLVSPLTFPIPFPFSQSATRVCVSNYLTSFH